MSHEEMKAVVHVLMNSYTPQDMQRIIYDFISRLEAELEKEKTKGEKRD